MQFLGKGLPLSVRQSLVILASRISPTAFGFEFAMGMLEDIRRRDPTALHRFLWSNHVAYATTYEVGQRFGPDRINLTRHMLFHNIGDLLRSRGMDPSKEIRSVLELGCSAGYLLRHLETEVFPSATVLHGIDIDCHAIQSGAAHLNGLGSKVELFAADLESADRIIGDRTYDIALCCGVLMYLSEAIAEKLVRTMLIHAGNVIGLICLPFQDRQERSPVRASDGAFVHNVGMMIDRAGGRVISSSLVDAETPGVNPSHLILAERAAN
jgi:SAM-dependent methyltransferase